MPTRIPTQHVLVIALLVLVGVYMAFQSGSLEAEYAPSIEESEVQEPNLMVEGECQVDDDCVAQHGEMDCYDFEVNQTGQCTANCRWFECQNGTCMAINVVAIKNYADDLGKTFGEECTHSSFLDTWH